LTERDDIGAVVKIECDG